MSLGCSDALRTDGGWSNAKRMQIEWKANKRNCGACSRRPTATRLMTNRMVYRISAGTITDRVKICEGGKKIKALKHMEWTSPWALSQRFLVHLFQAHSVYLALCIVNIVKAALPHSLFMWGLEFHWSDWIRMWSYVRTWTNYSSNEKRMKSMKRGTEEGERIVMFEKFCIKWCSVGYLCLGSACFV